MKIIHVALRATPKSRSLGKSASQFWWASIAGADCEPVEVTTLDGERVAYTCGCGDPFYLDRTDCPCVLVPGDVDDPQPMERPLTPKQEAAKFRRERRAMAEAQKHSWRGPR
jgi:hypothetical protein